MAQAITYQLLQPLEFLFFNCESYAIRQART